MTRPSDFPKAYRLTAGSAWFAKPTRVSAAEMARGPMSPKTSMMRMASDASAVPSWPKKLGNAVAPARDKP
ncbi:MAG: hypothetical protein Ct9H300mP8_02880 [Gammaproteobacteria bacterium]|nr:MAG: hypothetical protein Ct9H300mP8_02880 [Gammaproteobacteria bacterium]